MMGKPCTYCTLYNVRYINDGKTMHIVVRYIMYVISMMGKPCTYCTLYNVRYINDGKTKHIVYVI